MKIQHPTKGEFDTATATWQATAHHDGTPGDFDIGTSPDETLTALRDRHRAGDPRGYLVFHASEWASFVAGVGEGTFDDIALATARDEAALEARDV